MKKIICALLLISSGMFCRAQNPNITKISDNNYKVRVLPDYFHYERVNQGNDAYALAACLTMMINNLGLTVTQDQLIRLNVVEGGNMTGPQDAIVAMNAAAPGSFGRPAHIFCDMINSQEDVIFKELANNKPVLVMLKGTNGAERPVVLVSMNFSVKYDSKGAKNGISPNMVTLVSPAANAASQTAYTWSDFLTNASVLYTLKVSFN